jgi:hypothetical protein
MTTTSDQITEEVTTDEWIETPVDGLRTSRPHPLPFAPSLHVRTFRLSREAGDVLVYGAGVAAGAGIARHYLNHRHEAAFVPADGAAPLFVHADDREAVATKLHVRGSFARRHLLDGDFEVIPTPGHTPGATAYLWDSGEHRLLFTGDTIYLHEGEWVAAVLDSSDRDAYVASLDLIRGLEFDALVPWGATAGQPFVALTDRHDTQRRIDAILERVRAGGSR